MGGPGHPRDRRRREAGPPGFIDAHNHVRLGSDDACVQLAGAGTLDEVHARIRAWHAAHPDAPWIEAEAFDYSAIPGGRMPTAADLDPVTGDVPAFVLSYDVHTAWVNTAGLRRLGIDRDRTDLPFGEAVTDPATGEPTGFIRDFAVKGSPATGTAPCGCWGCRGPRRTGSTGGSPRPWTPPSPSASPPSSNRRTPWTTSRCSRVPARRAGSGPGW